MTDCLYSPELYQLQADSDRQIVPLYIIDDKAVSDFISHLSEAQTASLKSQNITLKAGGSGLLLNKDGAPDKAYLILGADVIWQAASAAQSLPAHLYDLDFQFGDEDTQSAVSLGFALAQYQPQNNAGKKQDKPIAQLTLKSHAQDTQSLTVAISFCRDLINAPANQLTPAQLALEAKALSVHYGASYKLISGKELETDFPAIHTVGRAAEVQPCLIDMSWGTEGPLICLVGKGITFDSGGLDLKPSRAMEMMKKDMGGAAHVLGLAAAIMQSGLKIRLRVVIAAAENAVSQASMRPMDVIDTKAGIKVEVGNTDAEGRLVLADALHLVCQDKPDFLLDFATLTGAARVALGTECPALFCNDDNTASALMRHGAQLDDPVWQLPLFEPYERFLDGGHMALSSTGQSGYGGAITAALFLRRFTGKDINWAHIDVMAWNLSSRAGRPKGGEAMGLRACFAYIQELAKAQ